MHLSGLTSGLTRRKIDMRAVGEVIVAAAGAVASGTAAGRLTPQGEAAAVPTRIRRVEWVRLEGATTGPRAIASVGARTA